MKGVVCCVVLVLLVACGGTRPIPSATENPTATVIRPSASATHPAATQKKTPTLFFTSTETSTATAVLCDPLEAYCIEAGHLVLERPIAPPGTIIMDRGYPYGSTQLGTREPHHGVEFNNATGVPVLAAADGVVDAAEEDSQKNYGLYPGTYGNLVVIEHHFAGMETPIYTLYGHLSRVEVRFGQTVRQGEVIGEVGSTGLAIGSHLHFEVREGRDDYFSNRNPALWMKPLGEDSSRLAGILAGRLVDSQGQPVYTDGLNVQYFPDRSGAQAAAWQVETYAPETHPVGEDDTLQENFALPDLTPGDYRISLIWGGRLLERWVKVEPGRISFFILQVDR